MTKRGLIKQKQPRKHPPRMDDPHIRTLLFYAQPDSWKRAHKKKARWVQYQDGADLIYALAVQYGYRCVKCGRSRRLGLDHIRPVSKGGRTEIENLQLMCGPCNEEKGDQFIDYRPKPEKVRRK